MSAKGKAASFGEQLKADREAKGLTQPELAHMMGYSPAAISKWELDKTVPSQRAKNLLRKVIYGEPGSMALTHTASETPSLSACLPRALRCTI